MDYHLALIFWIGGIGLAILLLSFLWNIKKKREINRLKKQSFPNEYRTFLNKTPHYPKLSDTDKKKIETSILIFDNTKEFMGVGVEITDEMKVIIAFYACLLMLHIETENCYDNLQTIIVYPSAVITDKINYSGGIYNKEKLLIDGQSSDDTVIIVWHDAKSEAYHLRHDNVIIHEFAHEIDFMDGEIDGIPPIEKSKYNEWTNILFEDYKKLNKIVLKDRDWGKYKLLGSYASTNEAEFFAVITERFFETPHSLKKHFPELYNELKDFYNIESVNLI